jgi:transposase
VNESQPDWEEPCRIFSISIATAYNWIREWNHNGYQGIAHPYLTSDKPRGRPPSLNSNDLDKLKSLLLEKPNWLTTRGGRTHFQALERHVIALASNEDFTP